MGQVPRGTGEEVISANNASRHMWVITRPSLSFLSHILKKVIYRAGGSWMQYWGSSRFRQSKNGTQIIIISSPGCQQTAAPPLVFICPPTLDRRDSSSPTHPLLPWAHDSITSLPTVPQLNLHLLSGLSHQHLSAQHVSNNLNRRARMLASAKFTVPLNFNLGPRSSFPSMAEGAQNHLGTEWNAYSCVSCGCLTNHHKLGGLKQHKLRAHFMLSMGLSMKGSREVI